MAGVLPPHELNQRESALSKDEVPKKDATQSLSQSVSMTLASWELPVEEQNALHFKLTENGKVCDLNGLEVGQLKSSKFLSRQWWKNVNRAFYAIQDSALFHYARPRELHVAISSIGELFVIAGSLIAGFSLQFYEIADLSSLKLDWYMPNAVFITLSFLSGIACVVVAAMLFIGISTIPVNHVHVFANHLSGWLLRPGMLMGASFFFMGAAFTTISLMAPYAIAAWVCVGLILLCLFGLILTCLILMERIVRVRDFVKYDTEREIKMRKRAERRKKDSERKLKSRSLKIGHKRRASVDSFSEGEDST
ncbi:hypothetical protein FVE85_1927 [Porphyridium purpureum]|uniref:Transmembrane protein n=1 Tax=Porphyridium purpureum TaxID=35688 RepID=A0A5J4YY21_PORPP|nr:hypothetical protein FVE85_1927 [Porphyridium purpureum]|eukprot:POR9796..scf209_3